MIQLARCNCHILNFLSMNHRQIAVLFLLLLISIAAFSQNKDGEVHFPETFDQPYVRVTEIEVSGNNLTRDQIVIRELDFKKGDTLSVFNKGDHFGNSLMRFFDKDSSEVSLRLNFSRDNIINTKLFLTTDLYLEQIEGINYRLKISVTERHYWWVFPVIKLNAPNFNEWLRDVDLSQLSMGIFGSHNNLFGSSHQASIGAYAGQSWALALGYNIPWIGKGQKKGVTFVGGYKNLAVVEYASLDNRREISYDRNSLETAFVGARMKLRPGLYHYNTIKLTAQYIGISDSIFKLNPTFLAANKTSNVSLSLYLDYYYDSRNNKSYPLEGNLLRAFIDKRGLGVLSKDVDIFYYGLDFHFYQKLNKKFYVAEMVKAVNSAGEGAPYYYQLSLNGKKDFIRGYDLYTIKGDQMYYFRSNIKYELVKPGVRKAKSEKNKFSAIQYAFYLNLLSDVGYVRNKYTEQNPLNNRFLFSWGAGLDFVTYYDLVFRFEYVFNSARTNAFLIGFGMPI